MTDPDRTIPDPLAPTGDRGGLDVVDSPPADTTASTRSTMLAGALFLCTGAALVGHVLTGVPLPLLLATLVVGVTGVGVVVHRDDPRQWWREHRHAVVVGVAAGIVSTAAYDGARWALVWAGELPASPWAALPFFGRALVGDGAPTSLVDAAGMAFHVANGIVFAIAYTIWFGRRAWWWGIGFGLALEAAMLAIYPGWLDIRAIGEFTQLSMLGHVCYGATLGGMVAWLRR